MGRSKELIYRRIPSGVPTYEELFWESYSINELEEIIANKSQYLDSFVAKAEAQLNTIKNQRNERIQKTAS